MKPIPHRSPQRRGLTLVELLVVVTILVMLIAITIPLVRLVNDDRPLQEATRIVDTQLNAAQSRARAKGRDVGVVLIRNTEGQGQVYQLAIAESPPPYAGETTSARAKIMAAGNTDFGLADLGLGVRTLDDGSDNPFVRPGDMIKFSFRGRKHTIYNVIGERRIRFRPATNLPDGAEVPFQIFRAPHRTAAKPIDLPVGAYVDLARSVATDGTVAAANGGPGPVSPFATTGHVMLVYNSSGMLDRLYGASDLFAAVAAGIDPYSNAGAVVQGGPVPVLAPIDLAITGGTQQRPKQTILTVTRRASASRRVDLLLNQTNEIDANSSVLAKIGG